MGEMIGKTISPAFNAQRTARRFAFLFIATLLPNLFQFSSAFQQQSQPQLRLQQDREIRYLASLNELRPTVVSLLCRTGSDATKARKATTGSPFTRACRYVLAAAPASSSGDGLDSSLYARRNIRLASLAENGMSRWGPSENRRAINAIDPADRSLFARRTIRLAYQVATQGTSRWGPSESQRALTLAQNIVLSSKSNEPPAVPVEITDDDKPKEKINEAPVHAPVSSPATASTDSAAKEAGVPFFAKVAPAAPAEAKPQAPVKEDIASPPPAQAPKDLYVARTLQVAERAEAGVARWGSSETTRANRLADFLSSKMAPAPAPKGTAAPTSKKEISGPPMGDRKLYQARTLQVAERAKVGKSRWGSSETIRASTFAEAWSKPAPDAPDSSAEVKPAVTSSPAPKQVTVVPPAAPIQPVKTTVQRRDLYKARTAQVAARSQVGQSRWGAPETNRASTITASSSTPAAGTPAQKEAVVSPPSTPEPQPTQPITVTQRRTIQTRWNNSGRSQNLAGVGVPVRSPLPQRPRRPQLAGTNGALLQNKGTASAPTGGRRVVSASPGRSSQIQSNSRWARSSTPIPNLASTAAVKAVKTSQPPTPVTASSASTIPKASVTTVTRRTTTARPGLAAVNGPTVNVVRRRQINVSNEADRPNRQPAIATSRGSLYRVPTKPGSVPSVTRGSPATVTAEPAITEAEVRSLFDLWNNALATLDSTTVAKRYAADPILLPTVSDTPRTDFASIKDYFDNFLKMQPQGVILDGKIKVGPNWAQDAGIYEFTMGTTGAKVRARYSFVYVFENGEWKISHHHSSKMPESGKAQVTEDECRGLFKLWNDALATLDSDTVAKRYAQNAVLLPTVSDTPRTDYASIKDYFDNFLKNKPQGVILDSFVTIGDGWCKDVGIYEFTMGTTGDKVRARYSFVYVKEDDEWKISHHHSSAMPESKKGNQLTIPEVRNLFTLWNDALATLDSDKVASRYAKESVLLPTVSDVPRTDYASKKDYFDNFLKNKPQGEILESYVQVGDGWCKDVGIYEFTMGTTGDTVRGRYSFVYVFEDGEWKISHHHSSIMPESVL